MALTQPPEPKRQKVEPGSTFWQVQRHGRVTSTNDLAGRLAEQGAAEGCVVVADAQSAGRGRQGRSWHSPDGAGLYVSAVLRPRSDVVPLLTIAAGVAIAEGIQSAIGLDPALKWPNDLFVGNRKLAGILAEAGSSPTGAQHVVLGFGINVLPAAFPPDVASRATSLEGEIGRSIDRGVLLNACLDRLASRYEDLQRGRITLVLDAWRRRAAPMLRRRVEWETGDTRAHGIAESIDETGALLIRTDDGIVRIISGEVRWI
jgi:BirA family biotin operon repressor/biotin-[acetyl-CoA-carboxylase] ligase